MGIRRVISDQVPQYRSDGSQNRESKYFALANLWMNGFFADHIIFVSHVLAAVFLILTEATINMRIIGPMLEGIEGMFFSKIPLVPTLIATAAFIIWATFSIFLYELLFKWILSRYQDHMTLVLVACFFIIMMGTGMKYRD